MHSPPTRVIYCLRRAPLSTSDNLTTNTNLGIIIYFFCYIIVPALRFLEGAGPELAARNQPLGAIWKCTRRDEYDVYHVLFKFFNPHSFF